MAEEVESLVLEASVIDDYSRNLNELSEKMASIGLKEESVFPVEAEAHIATAMAELEAFEKKVDRLDGKEVNIDVDTQVLSEQLAGMAAGPPDYDRVQSQSDVDEWLMHTYPGESQRVDRMMNRVNNRMPALTQPQRNVSADPGRRSTSNRLDSPRAINHAMRRAMFGTNDLANLPDMDDSGGFVGERRGPFSRLFRRFRRDMSDAIGEFADLRLSMGILMNIMASLVPLIVVFVGALPAAIAGVGALAAAAVAAAGALAGVVGLGLGAMLFEDGQLNVAEAQQHIRNLFDTFLEAFTPLMEALRPVAETMFRQAGFLIRDMATALDGLVNMTGDANDAIRWIADVMAAATAEAVAFADAAMPVMSFIVGGLAGIDWFGIFSDVIADTLPLLTEFAAVMMRIIPVIYELSLGFFEVTNTAFLAFAMIATLLDVVPGLAEALGTIVSLLLVAVTASALYSLATSTVITRVTGAIAVLWSYAAATIIAIARTYGMAAAFASAAIAAATFMAAITGGLSILTTLIGGAAGLNTQVGGAADQMRRFASQSRRARVPGSGDIGGNVGSDVGYSSPSGGNTVIAPDKETGNAVSNTLSFGGNQSSTTDSSDVTNRQHSGGG